MAFNEQMGAVVETGLSTKSRGYQANDAWGIAFSGLGQALSNGLTAYDEGNKAKIEQAAYAQVDDAVEQAMPPDIQGAASEVINQAMLAKEQGAYSETSFRTNIVQKQKALLAQYPQYKPHIQRMFSSALGSNTANDLRTARLQALDEATLGSKEKYNEHARLIDQNPEVVGSPEFAAFYKQETGNDFQLGSMDFDSVTVRKGIALFKARDAEIVKAGALAEADAKQAKPYGQAISNKFSHKYFSLLNNGPVKELFDNATKMGKDGLDATEREQLAQQWNVTKTTGRSALMDQLSNPDDPGLRNLSASDQKAIIDLFDQKLSTFEQALFSDDAGILKSHIRELAGADEDFQTELMRESPNLFRYTLLAKKLPMDVANNIWTSDKDGFVGDQMRREVRRMLTVELMNGKASFADIIKEEKANGKGPSQAGKMLNAVTQDLETVLTTPGVDPKVVAETVRNVFKPENFDFLEQYVSAKDRMTIFNRLIKPGTVELLKASGDTKALEAVERWATWQFGSVTAADRMNLTDANVNSDSVNITFDPKTGFTVDYSSAALAQNLGKQGIVIGSATNTIEYSQLVSARGSAATLNTYYTQMKPIWEARGLDPAMEMSKLMGKTATDENAKQGSYYTRMIKSIQEWANPTDAEGNPKKSSSAGGLVGSAQAATPPKSLVSYSRDDDGEEWQSVNVKEAYGPGRPGRPNEGIRTIAQMAAYDTGMENITYTSGKGNTISAAGKKRGQKTTMHSTGDALDVAGFASEEEKFKYIENAVANGANAVGVYRNGSVHIDTGKERHWDWSGYQSDQLEAAIARGKARRKQKGTSA